jgi:hypothetical protein
LVTVTSDAWPGRRFPALITVIEPAGAKQRRDRFAKTRDRGCHLHPREEPFVLTDAEPDPEGGAETTDGIVEPDARLDQMPAGGNDRARRVPLAT